MNNRLTLKYKSHPDYFLEEHIRGIQSYSENDRIFKEAALFHDLGKVQQKFQNYIKNPDSFSGFAVTHSDISALLWLLNRSNDYTLLKEDFFVFNAILSHHSKLHSFRSEITTNDILSFFSEKIPKEVLEEVLSKKDVVEFFDLDKKKIKDFLGKMKMFVFKNRKLKFSIQDFILQKYLFSKLIFADKYNAIFKKSYEKTHWDYPLKNLHNFKKENLTYDNAREKAKNLILKNYEKDRTQKIYLITAPTGIGKTLISLELALKIKRSFNKKKIIYLMPFTSIIDQTYELFMKIFPGRIEKHHHSISFPEDNENSFDKWKFLIENWDNDFVVSTFYQFFFALFSNGNSDNIKFHKMENSVIVFDEVQAIPFELWNIFNKVLPILANQLNITFILMSATMPMVDGFELSDKQIFFANQNRYYFQYLQLNDMEDLEENIITHFNNGKSVLCVVNTIKTCKLLYKKLVSKFGFDFVFCLNSSMLYQDRLRIINKLKENTSNNVKRKVLISTQVIEAGVDLDFDIGFREFAPLHAMVQTAGRINREGKKGLSGVYVFNFDNGKELVYSPQLMLETKKFFLKRLEKGNIQENEILSINENFFKQISKITGDSGIFSAIENFDFEKINNINFEKFHRNSFFKIPVVIGKNLEKLKFEFIKESEKLSKFEKFSLRLKYYKQFSPFIINVSRNRLADIEEPMFSDFWGLHYFPIKESVYNQKSGFLYKEEFIDKDRFL